MIIMDIPDIDVSLLYSTEDDEWKKYFFYQLENNDLRDIHVKAEPLEKFILPTVSLTSNYFEQSTVIIVVLSPASLNFFERNNLKLQTFLNPEKTIIIFAELTKTELLTSPIINLSLDEWRIYSQEGTDKIISAICTIIKQSNESKIKQKSNFKLVPRKVHEGKNKIYVILDEPLEECWKLKVFTNAVEETDIAVKKVNPYTWQFEVPEHYIRDSAILTVGIRAGNDTIGMQKLKCESRLGQLHSLLSACCSPIELMIDSLEVNSHTTLDRTLAEAFKKRFPRAELCDLYIEERDVKYSKAKEELPTLIHFAARYGLQHLLKQLLLCPGALSACNMKNSSGRTPKDLAADFKHRDLVETISDFLALKSSEMKRSHSYEYLPLAPVPPIKALPTTNRDNIGNSDDNVYDIPPSPPIPVPHVDYEVMNKQSFKAEDTSFMPDFSPLPNTESFSESQAKLLEINEAYKKGASETEVLSMFNKWKATYHADSEAKTMLEILRNLYAHRNKVKMQKKHSINFSDFKHLFKLKFRKKSLDTQENDHFQSNMLRYKNQSAKSDCKLNNGGRNSNTFSTNSYTSASSSSSSDRLSFASENSDYYDYVSNFLQLSGLQEKNSSIPNSQNSRSVESLPPPVPNRFHLHSGQKSSNYNKRNGVNDNANSQSNNNSQSKHTYFLHNGNLNEASVTLKVIKPEYDDGYDIIPIRNPLPVEKPSETIKQNSYSNIMNQVNSQHYDPSQDYDVPKPTIQLNRTNSLNLIDLHSETPSVIYRNKNKIASSVIRANIKCNCLNNGDQELTYENLHCKETISRRDSMPAEMAPLPPTNEEEEYYKYVGAPVPVLDMK